MEGEFAIEVKDLCKSYGSLKALNGISFDVKRGEIFGMLGPNGAGKTTTMEILIGLRTKSSGIVKVLGNDPQKEPKRVKSRIGVQLQNVFLFTMLKVIEVLRLFASFYPNPLLPEDVINRMGLWEKRNSMLKDLSGGQLQRVAVAIALISNGDIIFLDEPTAGLDPQSRHQLWEVILNLKKEGKTIFLTTHFMDEAQKLCDRVAVVDKGRIIALGSPQELIDLHFKETAVEISNVQFLNKESLIDLPGVQRIQKSDETITLYTVNIVETIAGLTKLSSEAFLDNIRIRHATLEDVFLKLTGRRIRE